MADEEWAELFLDMAIIGRREGLQVFKPLLEFLDDKVLLAGMRATILDRRAPAQILDDMKTSLQQIRLQLKRREAMVVAGIYGIQSGHKPHDLVAAARAASEEQGKKLLDASHPAMNA